MDTTCNGPSVSTVQEYFERMYPGKEVGSRKWLVYKNNEATFSHDFMERVKETITAKYRNPAPTNLWTSLIPWIDGRTKTDSEIGRQMVDKSCMTEDVNCREEFEIGRGEQGNCFAQKDQDPTSIDTVDKANQLSVSDDGIVKPRKPDDVYAILNDTRRYVEVEGFLCSKRKLAEWAIQYHQSKACNSASNTGLQQPSGIGVVQPAFRENPNQSFRAENSSNIPPTISAGNSFLNQVRPSSMGPSQPVAATPSTLAPQCGAAFNTPIRYPNSNIYSRFEQARSWKPGNESQQNALEQTKTDIFNLLLVCKGCALTYLARKFEQVVQEELNLKRIGVPDLPTLLLQMENVLVLKRHKLTGHFYVFPHLGTENLNAVAHIGELVAEQRSSEIVPLPDPDLLIVCNMQSLFTPPVPTQGLYHQQTQYSATNGNNYFWNRNAYYNQYNHHQYQNQAIYNYYNYWNHAQYQNPWSQSEMVRQYRTYLSHMNHTFRQPLMNIQFNR